MKRSNATVDPPRGKRARPVVPTSTAIGSGLVGNSNGLQSRRRASGNRFSSDNDTFYLRPSEATLTSNANQRSYWISETILMERYTIAIPAWDAYRSKWNNIQEVWLVAYSNGIIAFGYNGSIQKT
jgi:hypothetical protein